MEQTLEKVRPSAPPAERPAAGAGKGPRHFAYIDAVRGIAFLGVFFIHASLTVGHFPGISLLWHGKYGVQLFFIASAVTLCNSMESRRKHDRFPVTFFYLRRFFRIAPLYWCALLFYLAWTGATSFMLLWPKRYVGLTAVFLQGWHPYTIYYSAVPGGWSVAVEMTFYALFPILFLLVNSLRRATLALLASIVYLFLLEHSRLAGHLFPHTPTALLEIFDFQWFPHQLPAFIVGLFTYHLLKNESVRELARSRFYSNCLFVFCVMGLLSVFYGHSYFISDFILIVLFLAGIVVSISGRPTLLVNPVICYIGTISFSCYLVHFAALEVARRVLGIHLTRQLMFFDAGSSLRNVLTLLELTVIGLSITVAVSTVTFQLIESPGITLGKRALARIASIGGLREGGRV